MNDQPEIAAGDLVLRPWRRGDAAAVVLAWADPEIRRWGGYGAQVPTREGVEQWVDWNHEQWQYGLRAGFAISTPDADGAELVGSIMLRDCGRAADFVGHGGDTGETGYWIVEERRGRGVATSAVDALSRWAFHAADEGGLGLRRIELRHSVHNAGSCRVAENAGFQYEGTMRESFRYIDGDWHDEHLHARLSSD